MGINSKFAEGTVFEIHDEADGRVYVFVSEADADAWSEGHFVIPADMYPLV